MSGPPITTPREGDLKIKVNAAYLHENTDDTSRDDKAGLRWTSSCVLVYWHIDRFESDYQDVLLEWALSLQPFPVKQVKPIIVIACPQHAAARG
ncbi:hypothetical protein BaRGS_00034704 [Batillaria attramentaria]|uniref:Uncharacterized protein n=1 Tax=Batillaria attramentaria TaxID=370345 RepID=A0ABD0JGK0_9CAEN